MSPASSKRTRSWRLAAAALSLAVLGALGWAALAPIEATSHEELFEIPRGTSARRLAGEKIEILPQTIRLTLGLNDVLVFRNSDSAPHIFGPTLIMPGQSFRLPFAQASTYSFQCTAHADGHLDIIVEPHPAPGWQRVRWRWRKLANDVTRSGLSA
ncbi:MAG TPA: hypothetical protein VM662_12665 [Sphingomonas sp.]|nr:hypothetical protein [Sphingomonas sp.]